MANIQTVKAQKAEKTLRLLTILLLVLGIAAIAVAVYDWASESSLLTLFDAPAAEAGAETVAAVDTEHGGLTVAYVLLIVSGLLLVFLYSQMAFPPSVSNHRSPSDMPVVGSAF